MGDRCIHKKGKKLEGIEVVHYSDLSKYKFDSLIVTSQYHSAAIIAEIEQYLDLEKIDVRLLEEDLHRSL